MAQPDSGGRKARLDQGRFDGFIALGVSMRALVLTSAAVALVGAAPPPAKPLTPSDIVAAAPASAWRDIPADDLLVVEMPGARKVIIQLAPVFAPVHVANIRAFARSNWWEGSTIYRVQDNYVVQWGQNETEKPFPAGVVAKPAAEYHRSLKGLTVKPLGYPDAYAPRAGFAAGWPVAYDPKSGTANLTHCYGYVGVARDLAPDTGTGAELYAIIGHAPRQLDRNIAVVGRVIEGIDAMSPLPRGTEALGFYKDPAQPVPITVKLASQLAPADQPRFQQMDVMSATFASYLRLRANRKDAFYERPAGGVDLCNAPVPVRRKPA
jgi:peptidylprolyl isomerase